MRSTRAASRLLLALYVIVAALVSSANAQWEDGGMDPREEEFFAARMNQNQGRRDLYQEPARAGVLPIVGGLLGGFLLDMQWGKRSIKKLQTKQAEDLKAAEVAINKMLNNDVYKRNLHLQELEMALELAKARVFELQQSAEDANVDLRKYGLAPEQLQAAEDRREFQLPDANKDGKITRAEFNAYITEYLKQSPGLTRADMPRFEDFDFSKDGTVSFAEWQRYLDQQRLEDLAATANAAGKSVAKTYSSNQQAARAGRRA